MKKMWALMVHMNHNMWGDFKDPMAIEDKVWDDILKEMADAGLDTVVLDLGDGVQYKSHPEISIEGAWSHERVHAEIAKARALGIRIIPKLNFATPHDIWLGEYNRMVSTSIYYQVCRDLIHEVYELFEQPEYIHLGMDEEDARHVRGLQHAVFRQGDLYWHDVRFLIDCVKETGAMPWMWSCPLFSHPEEYGKHIGPDEAILSPWYYNAFRKEHWTPVSSREVYVTYYNEGEYASMGIEYVEQDPFLVDFRKVALPLMKEGYLYVPCASVVNRCDWNTPDLLEYFKVNAPDEQVRGFIAAPWCQANEAGWADFKESIQLLKDARAVFYPEQ